MGARLTKYQPVAEAARGSTDGLPVCDDDGDGRETPEDGDASEEGLQIARQRAATRSKRVDRTAPGRGLPVMGEWRRGRAVPDDPRQRSEHEGSIQ